MGRRRRGVEGRVGGGSGYLTMAGSKEAIVVVE